MTDFTWYTRLLVWVGALVLLIEGTIGHPYGVVTVLAVIALAMGLLGFVGGLSFEGLGAPTWLTQVPEDAAPVPEDKTPPARMRESTGISPVVPESISETSAELEDEPEKRARTPATVLAEPPSTVARVPPPRAAVGAVTADLAAEHLSVGRPCFGCHEPLRVGQTVARCPECGGVHHATCWVDNHFHCARDGCGGHGGLQAPETE